MPTVGSSMLASMRYPHTHFKDGDASNQTPQCDSITKNSPTKK